MTDKIIDTLLIILATVLLASVCFTLSGAYQKAIEQSYQRGYNEGYKVPIDQTGAQRHINEQLKRMLDDDRNNPVCEYYTDSEGYRHGCLTDEQLDAIIELDTFINNEM